MTSDDAIKEAILSLPPLSQAGKRARKKLGQHFLHDLTITRQIARSADIRPEETIIEIGPGTGGLTRALLLEGARHVIAVEQDADCVSSLEALVRLAGGRLTVFHEDARDFAPALAGSAPRRIIANLPYNIATFLLLKWLRNSQDFAGMVLMFQKEVAMRITASPGSKTYGRLSVLAQYCFDCTILMDFPPDIFTPKPLVRSALVGFSPKEGGGGQKVDYARLEKITRAAFTTRRKKLEKSLTEQLAHMGASCKIQDIRLCCKQAGIDPSLRPEQLSVDDFVNLARTTAPYIDAL